MKNYNRPFSVLIQININESLATSSEHVPLDAADSENWTEQDDVGDDVFEDDPDDNTCEFEDIGIDEDVQLEEDGAGGNGEFIEDETVSQVVGDIDPIKDTETSNDSIDDACEVTLSDTNGEYNRDILNAALQTNHYVKILSGDYPLSPGVIVDSAVLDLGGAHLTCTESAYGGALIIMCGKHPVVRNGQLSGLYSAAKGEPGYLYVEHKDENGNIIPIDSTIKFPIGGFTDAVIDNVKFDHCCGYTICPGGEDQIGQTYSIRHVSPKTPSADESCRFELTSDFTYVTARHAIGYNYMISNSDVTYEFFDDDFHSLSCSHGVPGESILRPDGAKYVDVHVQKDPFLQFGLFEYAFDNSITISNCDFWCNQRLAIVNLPGDSVIENCHSWSNGYPRENHDGLNWDSSTSGFIDIEDVQTPHVKVIGCTSENENLGIASRAYYLFVDSCRAPVQVYGGWSVNVRNHVGGVRHMKDDSDTKIYIEDSALCDMWGARIGQYYDIKNCTVELCTQLNDIRNFNCVIGDDYKRTVCIRLDGVVVGTIHGNDGWFELGTKEGSSLVIRIPEEQCYGTRAALSDTWGLDSNLLLLPNGCTIHDSKFIVNTARTYPSSAPSVTSMFCGAYENCEFDIHADEAFVTKAIRMDGPIELKFNGCDFNIDSDFVLIKGAMKNGLENGSTILFNGCTINGETMTQETAERITSRQRDGIKIVVT